MFQVDDNQDEGLFIHSDSLQSFEQVGGGGASIIKQQANNTASTNLSVGLQSPDRVEDQDFLIQWCAESYSLDLNTMYEPK